jgi:hypothetical protein
MAYTNPTRCTPHEGATNLQAQQLEQRNSPRILPIAIHVFTKTTQTALPTCRRSSSALPRARVDRHVRSVGDLCADQRHRVRREWG